MKLIITLLVFTSVCLGQTWYKGEAVAVGGEDIPIARLRQQALTKARVAALEQGGVVINSNTTRVQSEAGTNFVDIYGSFAQSDSRGIIVEERNVSYTSSLREEHGEAVVEVKAALEARIEIPDGKPDPAFEVQLKTDKASYREGEEMQLSVTSTKDGYLSLFRIKNDSCFILYPHPLLPKTKANHLAANTSLSIPPLDKPYSYELNLEGGDGKSVTECIIAIVTKDDLPVGGMDAAREYFTLQEFSAWLAKTNLERRASASAQIQIVKK